MQLWFREIRERIVLACSQRDVWHSSPVIASTFHISDHSLVERFGTTPGIKLGHLVNIVVKTYHLSLRSSSISAGMPGGKRQR